MIATVLTGRRATWIVLAFSLIVLALLSPVTGKLKSVQNNDSINYLPRGAQSTQVQQILADLPGGNTADAVVVYARTAVATPSTSPPRSAPSSARPITPRRCSASR